MRGIVELFHPVAVLEDFARLGAVGRTDNAVLLHQVDQARGAPVSDAQAALQRGSGCAARVTDHANGVLVKIVVDTLPPAAIPIASPFRLTVFSLRRPTAPL